MRRVGAGTMLLLQVHCAAPDSLRDAPTLQAPEPGSRAALSASTSDERRFVLLTERDDTVSIETVREGAGWMETSLTLPRRAELQRLFVTRHTNGAVTSWDVSRRAQTPGARRDERWRVHVSPDSVFVVHGELIGAPVEIDAHDVSAPVTPWHAASIGVMELLARRGLETATALTVPGDDRWPSVTVHRASDSTTRLSHPDGDWLLQFDASGRVRGAESPTRGLRFRPLPATGDESAPDATPDDATPDDVMHDQVMHDDVMHDDVMHDEVMHDEVTAGTHTAPRVLTQSLMVRAVDDVRLAGTLTRPSGQDVVPLVLFVSGSGPQDRDLGVPGLPGYRPFAELAHALAVRGIASVRFDDRGVGESGGSAYRALWSAEVHDAQAVLAAVRARSDVRVGRVAIVGHSDGAHTALAVAAADAKVRALLLLGASARSGRELARAQRADWLAHSRPTSTATSDARAAAPRSAEQTRVLLADAEAATERLAALDPWLRDWLRHDPRADVRPVSAAVMLAHGTRDVQVPVAHAHELAALLREERSATHVRVLRLPHVNHLLLSDSVGEPRGYARLSSRRLPASVRVPLLDWLTQQLIADTP